MYIRGFDGLRAIAVLLVFFTHKTGWGEKGQVGFAGVWMFFLLSGFLITGQLIAGRARVEARHATLWQEVTTFWIKRILRIFPAYYVLLMLVVPYYVLNHRDVPGLAYYVTYLSNFYFQAEPKGFLTTFAHLWSLAVEEQFYIFFAPFLLLVPRRYAAAACGLVIAASLARRFWLAQSDAATLVAYIDSLVNFGILALGALLYLWREGVSRVLRSACLNNAAVGCIAMLLLLACPPLALHLAGASPVRLELIYVAGVMAAALLLVNVFSNQRSMLTNLLEYQPIVYIGRISYGLYLYNDYVKADLPLRALRLVSHVMGDAQRRPAVYLEQTTWGPLLLGLLGFVVCLGGTIAMAQLSRVLIEMPALRLRDWLLAGRPKTFDASPKGPIDSASDLGVTFSVEPGRLATSRG